MSPAASTEYPTSLALTGWWTGTAQSDSTLRSPPALIAVVPKLQPIIAEVGPGKDTDVDNFISS